MPGPSNWASSVGKSTRSDCVGFSIFNGSDISSGGNSGGKIFGNSGGVRGGISVGGISSENDGSIRGSMNGMGSGINYGVGGSVHGRGGGFFLEDGNGHRSACPTDMSKPSSHIRPFLCLGYISIIFSSLYYSIDS
jgi:hypothetical protein